MLTVGSLFTGCYGLDLGLEATGAFRVLWACESDPPCRRVLERRLPELVVYDNVVGLDWIDPPDVLVGGFPCQDVSQSGRKRGLSGDRSGLWAEYADCIRLLRPRLVLVENVPGLAIRGLDRVLADLAACGYVGRWLRLRASDVGAPHGRERLFVFARRDASVAGPARRGRAHARRDGQAAPDAELVARTAPGSLEGRPLETGEPGLPGQEGATVARAPRGARVEWGVYERAVRRWERRIGRPAPGPTDARGNLEPAFVEWMLGFPHEWTAGETRRERLRMLGNAVQVQVAELAGRMLLELEAAA